MVQDYKFGRRLGLDRTDAVLRVAERRPEITIIVFSALVIGLGMLSSICGR